MEVPQVPLAQIAKLARQYYPSLPPAGKAFLDVEDLIQIGAIRWVEFYPRYDKRRAGISTFTHHVIRSYYLEIIRTFRRAKHHQQIMIPVEDIRTEVMSAPCHLKETGAHQRVEKLIRMASPRLRQFLGIYFFNGGADFRGWNRALSPIKLELEWLIARTGVSADDFRACQTASLRSC